jgi:hypothetical protein
MRFRAMAAMTAPRRIWRSVYAYRIDLPSGAPLRFDTLNQQPSEQYELRKEVLDAMMTTLRLTAN